LEGPAVTIEIEGFVVDREIGRGGFGVVYRAIQVAFNRPVAIKVLHAGTPSADLQKRFAHECRAVGSLHSHPNILSVYSTGLTKDGSPYLAMELLTGGSLSERIPLAPDAVAALGVRLANALHLAHKSGVIHRDVKPSNVLFNAADEPVLVDFGISSLIGEASTSTGDVAVSIGYTPPEILDGARPGVAADVYALGATLFAAVTGRTPFVVAGGFSSIAVMAARIVTQPVEDLRPLGVPDRLCTVIETAMAKDPTARYESMTQMREALQPIANEATIRTPHSMWGGAPVALPMDTTHRQRRRRLAARLRAHRKVVAAVAAVAVVVGVASVTTAVLASPGGTDAQDTGILLGASSSGAVSSTTGSTVASTGLPSRTPASSSGPKPKASKLTILPNGRTTIVIVQPPPAVGPAGDGGVTTSPAPAPADTAPQVQVGNQSNSERASPTLVLRSYDPDLNDRVTFDVYGLLPSGLSWDGSKTISGTISANAVNATTNYRSLQSRSFSFSVTVTDSHGKHRTKNLTWTVKDTHLTMPNYVGYYGCNGDGSCHEPVPNVSAAFHQNFGCHVSATAPGGSIYSQSIPHGSVVAWGARATFIYNQSSC
jgi:serine/threonine protein kinase